MRITHRTTGIVISIALCVLIASSIGVLSGNLNPPSTPGAISSSFLTLEDIYNRLNSGTSGTAITFTEPTVGPAVTMHMLDEIMAKAPAPNITSGAAIIDVLAGKTFWGLTTPGGVWGLTSGTGVNIEYRALVPRTGTTTGGIGEDGNLKKGVVWPDPRFTITSSGLTVLDNLTGLVWTRNASNSGITWADAITTCSALALTSYGGYSDWRLPSAHELFSLIDFAYKNPALSNTSGAGIWTEGEPFNGVPSSGTAYYWSSTPDAHTTTPNNRMAVSLGFGDVISLPNGDPYYVWPVRGGQ